MSVVGHLLQRNEIMGETASVAPGGHLAEQLLGIGPVPSR
jgi:hypothetical protein